MPSKPESIAELQPKASERYASETSQTRIESNQLNQSKQQKAYPSLNNQPVKHTNSQKFKCCLIPTRTCSDANSVKFHVKQEELGALSDEI